MSEQPGRGAAEEQADVPATPEENNEPASPSSMPGGSSRVRGAAEEESDTPRTE